MHNGDFKVGFSLVSLLYDISMSELIVLATGQRKSIG